MTEQHLLNADMEELMTSNISEEYLVQEVNKHFRDTVFGVTIFLGIEMAFGFFGNLITIYLFMFHYKNCNFRLFVLSLALIDLISCVTAIPGEMVGQMFWYAYPYPALCKAKVFFNQFTVCSGAILLTLIAFDRYRKVCRPFEWQISRHAAIGCCVGAFVISAAFSVPMAIVWGVHGEDIVYKGRNISLTLCVKDELYRYTMFPLTTTLMNGCLVTISMIGMFVMYVCLARRLFKRNVVKPNLGRQINVRPWVSGSEMLTKSPRSQGSISFQDSKMDTSDMRNIPSVDTNVNKRNKQMATTRRKTKIGFYMALIYIVTTLTHFALLSTLASSILSTLDHSSTVVFFFFLRLYFINHVTNPVLYGMLDTQFRTALVRLKVKLTNVVLCKRTNEN